MKLQNITDTILQADLLLGCLHHSSLLVRLSSRLLVRGSVRPDCYGRGLSPHHDKVKALINKHLSHISTNLINPGRVWMCETTRVVTMTPHSHISTPRGPRTSNRSFGTILSSWVLGKVDIESLKCLSIKICHLHLCYLLLRHLCMIPTASSIFPDYVCLRWVR